MCPGSRHGLFRKLRIDAKDKLFDLTLRKAMEAEHPGLWETLKKDHKINDSEMTIEFPNGSIIAVKGLDDATQQERILGDEYATIAVDEISQFREFNIIQLLIGRLSQEYEMEIDGKPIGKKLTTKLFLMCNPPKTKRHWSYAAFILGLHPISQEPHPRPHEWAEILMNPMDNAANISSTYVADLENMSAADRNRFLMGEWGSENEDGMFKASWWRGDGTHKRRAPIEPEHADFDCTVVSVDPAASVSLGADETGIIVAARSNAEQDRPAEAFILEDCSGKMTPDGYGRAAVAAYYRWNADYIVVERDGLGLHAKAIIHGIDPGIPIVLEATAGVEKPSRALPIAGFYEAGRVHHCGTFQKLEDQMEEFSLDWSRRKDGSPDRLDAMVYAIRNLLAKEMVKRGAARGTFNLFN